MFSVTDVFRILGGLLLLNSVLSWWFTSSTTWGYEGRYLDTQYYKFQYNTFPKGQIELTIDELMLYNGSDPGLPIYIAIYHKIYDVSASRSLYTAPLGRYLMMAGKESARMLATACIGKNDELTSDLRGLDEEYAMGEIFKWQSYYEGKSKYWQVGYLKDGDEVWKDKEIPSPCTKPLKIPQNVGSLQ